MATAKPVSISEETRVKEAIATSRWNVEIGIIVSHAECIKADALNAHPGQRVMGYRWPGYYFAIRNEPICRYPRSRLASYEYFFDGWTFDWSCPSALLRSTKFQSVSRLFHASILARYSYDIFAGQY